MSYLTYIASDYSLPIVKNPHDKLLSVNEADHQIYKSESAIYG